MLETWKRRSDRELTLAGYISTGRVQGAISATADSIFWNELDAGQQAVAQEIFLRLTELGDDTPDTRQGQILDSLPIGALRNCLLRNAPRWESEMPLYPRQRRRTLF